MNEICHHQHSALRSFTFYFSSQASFPNISLKVFLFWDSMRLSKVMVRGPTFTSITYCSTHSFTSLINSALDLLVLPSTSCFPLFSKSGIRYTFYERIFRSDSEEPRR